MIDLDELERKAKICAPDGRDVRMGANDLLALLERLRRAEAVVDPARELVQRIGERYVLRPASVGGRLADAIAAFDASDRPQSLPDREGDPAESVVYPPLRGEPPMRGVRIPGRD